MMLLWEKGPHQDWPYCLISLFHWINSNMWRENASLGSITQQCDKYVIIPDESHEAGQNSKWTLLKSTQFGYPYHVDMKYVYYAPYMRKIECSLWGYLSGTTTPGVNEWSLNVLSSCNMHAHMSDRFEAYKRTMAASYFCMQPTLICTKGFDPLFMWTSMMLNRWAKLTDRSIKKLTCERHR